MDTPLKQALISAANAIEAAAALALSNAQRALSDAERHAAFAKDAVAKIKAAQEAEEMPSAVLDVSVSGLCTCDVCCQPCRGGANAQGFCGSCAENYEDALKYYPEELADATLKGPDAIRLLVLRLSAENIRQDEELHDVYYYGARGPGPMEALLNQHAEQLLQRLPATFAPWWKQKWTYEKWCEMKEVRKAEDWAVSESAPILRRLAALFAAEQNKASEQEKAHEEAAKAMRSENIKLEAHVELLRKFVEPTKKLMNSKPELFGGEALPPVGMSSPHPLPIVRLRQPLSEQQKRLLMAFKVLVPYERSLVEPTEEQTPTDMPCMAATKAEADAVQSLPRPPPPSPILVPDQPTMCTAAGCIVCPPAEPVAEQTRICCVGCGKPKPDYNNPRWPSPRAKRFAKHIATHSGKDPKTIKTHESALEFLAQRAKISVDALLKMEMRDYQTAHAPWSITGIYGPDDRSVFYMG